MALKTKVMPAIKSVAIDKAVLRGTTFAEVAKTCGAGDDIVNIANFGTQRGLLSEIHIYAMKNSTAVDKFLVRCDRNAEGQIEIEDLEDKSVVERMDAGMGVAVGRFAGQLKAKGLTPEFYFVFHPHIYDDPLALATARKELNLSPTDTPAWMDGYEEKQIVGMTGLAKDKGLGWGWSKAMRRKGGGA